MVPVQITAKICNTILKNTHQVKTKKNLFYHWDQRPPHMREGDHARRPGEPAPSRVCRGRTAVATSG
jgi:hypothetical protein